MAGFSMSGLGDLSRELNKLSKGISKLDGLSVSVEDGDTISSVTAKLRREIRRSGAYEPTDSELRDIARQALADAKRSR